MKSPRLCLYDYHIHTSASDGKYDPEKVVRLSQKQGMKSISITDHHTFGGIRKIMEDGIDGIVENIDLIPGIEIEAGNKTKMFHLLAYFKDLPPEGAAKEILGSMQKSFLHKMKRYLGSNLISRQEIEKAILVIKKVKNLGGMPVLAHPFTLGLERNRLDELVKTLVDSGLEGLEIYNSRDRLRKLNTKADNEFLLQLADEYKLVKIAGSDYHGKGETEIGSIPIQYCFKELYKKI